MIIAFDPTSPNFYATGSHLVYYPNLVHFDVPDFNEIANTYTLGEDGELVVTPIVTEK